MIAMTIHFFLSLYTNVHFLTFAYYNGFTGIPTLQLTIEADVLGKYPFQQTSDHTP